LPHEHAKLTDEVSRFNDEHHPLIPAVDQVHTAFEYDEKVVGITGFPQHLTWPRVDDDAGSVQEASLDVAEFRPCLAIAVEAAMRGVLCPFVGYGLVAACGKMTSHVLGRSASNDERDKLPASKAPRTICTWYMGRF
jgi:hypothetical protein